MAARKKPSRSREAKPEVVELVVRRGALRRFDKLKTAVADLPVKLTWDRRLSNRRTDTADVPHDRRKTDRRKRPPFTWDAADFLVVQKRRNGS